MAISLNSVMSFTSTKLQAKYKDASRYSSIGASLPNATTQFTPFFAISGSRILAKEKRFSHCFSLADSDQLAEADANSKNLPNAEASSSNDESPNPPDETIQNPKSESSQTSEGSNGSIDQTQQSTTKRSSLTARERLRAARVLSRYNNESKATKSDMGRSRVLDAMKESDRGKKRSRLPEAPTNIFDDSKRGMPKQGLTFDFPGGFDLFVIAFSFVFISSVMFATTYFVWKVGAIHFNEY